MTQQGLEAQRIAYRNELEHRRNHMSTTTSQSHYDTKHAANIAFKIADNAACAKERAALKAVAKSATESLPAPIPAHTAPMMTPAEIKAMSDRMGKRADAWLARNTKKPKEKPLHDQSKAILNPFAGYLKQLGQEYPHWAMDIIEGIARLDWHNRDIGVGGVSKQLSIRKIIHVLDWLPVITNAAVEELLGLGERHARRYVKAASLCIPHMLKCRPDWLLFEMDGVEYQRKPHEWEDMSDIPAPDAETLAKLHHDMRTFTEYATEEEYDKVWSNFPRNVIVNIPTGKKAIVMQMLADGKAVKAIVRETGVTAQTIRRWRDSYAPV